LRRYAAVCASPFLLSEAPETMRENVKTLGRLFPDAGVGEMPGLDRMVQAVRTSASSKCFFHLALFHLNVRFV
jgi:hypothetical protein